MTVVQSADSVLDTWLSGGQRLDVALVLGTGRSEEEARLGEALGLAYLESAIRHALPDVSISVLNAILAPAPAGQSAEANGGMWGAIYGLRQPAFVGVSIVFQHQTAWTRAFLDAIKLLSPETFVLVGGMYPTSAYRELLDDLPMIDAVYRGEADIDGPAIVQAVLEQRELSEFPFLIRRGGPPVGDRHASRLTEVELANAIPPTRSQAPAVIEGGGVLMVEASRGCNAGCKFCDARQTSWRPRSVDSLIAELVDLDRAFPGALVYMVDNIFLGFSNDGSHLRRGREFARRLGEAGLSLRFSIQDRAENVDRATFAALRDAGLASVYLGIESFSSAQLTRMAKGAWATPESNRRALDTLEDLKIYTQFGFLPFDEGSNWAELVQTFDGLERALAGKSFVHLSNLNEQIPYPGTNLARTYADTHDGERPPISNPWRWDDPRVMRLRNCLWQFSVSQWQTTSAIFNHVQDQRWQVDLSHTIAVKNHHWLETIRRLMWLVEAEASVEAVERAIDAQAAATAAGIEDSLGNWENRDNADQLQSSLVGSVSPSMRAGSPDPGPGGSQRRRIPLRTAARVDGDG